MKVFVVLCIFFVTVTLTVADPEELQVEEDNLADVSKAEEAYENLQENEVTAEGERRTRCRGSETGTWPHCHRRSRPRSEDEEERVVESADSAEEEERGKQCGRGYTGTWPHCSSKRRTTRRPNRG